MAVVFIDTETTGLNPDTHEIWELAIIKRVMDGDRTTDVEAVYQIRPDMVLADHKALEIGRFHDRFVVPGTAKCAIVGADDRAEPIGLDALRYQVGGLLKDATLVGSNPSFDATFTRKLLGRPPRVPWHYRVVDVIDLAAGALLAHGVPVNLPWKSEEISRMMNVEPPQGDARHSALGDARWVRDLFDVATGAGYGG